MLSDLKTAKKLTGAKQVTRALKNSPRAMKGNQISSKSILCFRCEFFKRFPLAVIGAFFRIGSTYREESNYLIASCFREDFPYLRRIERANPDASKAEGGSLQHNVGPDNGSINVAAVLAVALTDPSLLGIASYHEDYRGAIEIVRRRFQL